MSVKLLPVYASVRDGRRPPRRSSTRLGIVVGIVMTGFCGSAVAENVHPADVAIGNPSSARLIPLAAARRLDAELASVAAPKATGLEARGGEVAWNVDIRYTEGQIFNPRTGQFDKVRLRSYQGDGVDLNVPFVAPTVNLRPGETFRLTLNNKLPANDRSCQGGGDVNTPHCFNSTNMHTHGLWVNPSGNSDNVLIRILPNVSFTYEYNIPADHPAGTFWYHPHLHGSTALQVSSGMAGALIIRGDRLPTADGTGDVDTLLRNADGTAIPERVLLFQQIPYACREIEGGPIKTDAAGTWICDPGEVGTIERYDQFGPGLWSSSGRYTSINGRVVPTFNTSIAGQIERWRLIHAGVRDSITLEFKKLSAPSTVVASATAYTAVTSDAQSAFVDANCSGATAQQLSLATDGLTRDRLVTQDKSHMHPGYREDLLMVFPEPGTYCIVDADAVDVDTVAQETKSRKLMGFVEVGPGAGIGNATPAEYIKQRLIEAARLFMPVDLHDRIVADLEQRLGLAAFQPHDSLLARSPQLEHTLGFVIRGGPNGPVFQIGALNAQGGLKDPQSYDPDRIDRNLILGNIDDWELRSFLGGHPFHIHVNPFQIVEILDADGRDVSGYEPDNTSPYARLKGTWKDTLFVTQERRGATRTPYRIRVRMHYRRYIGDFVLHCHILDHEDRGMMQNVRIALPDGKGGIVATHR